MLVAIGVVDRPVAGGPPEAAELRGPPGGGPHSANLPVAGGCPGTVRCRRGPGRPATAPRGQVVSDESRVAVAPTGYVAERGDVGRRVDGLGTRRDPSRGGFGGPDRRRHTGPADGPPARRAAIGGAVVDGNARVGVGVERHVRGGAAPAPSLGILAEPRLGGRGRLVCAAPAAAGAPRGLRGQRSGAGELETCATHGDDLLRGGWVVDRARRVTGRGEVARRTREG